MASPDPTDVCPIVMNQPTLELFTESAWGGLPPGQARTPAVQEPDAAWDRSGASPPETPEFVETLGFPKGTSTVLLAEVLQDIHATAPGARVQRLLTPGVLSRLFSQSAAEASYALAVLSIVESPGFESTLARLRSC
jgi:hypothetical protein